jgi:hypothetical protein
MRLVLDARTAALGGLIDYAGLFPPASLSVPDALDEYRRVRHSNDRWVMGRFLCRASHLEQLAAAATSTFTRGEAPWEVGVIFDASPGASAAMSVEFQQEMAPVMRIAAAEAKLHEATTDAAGVVLDAMATIDTDIACFLELDRDEDVSAQVHAIGEALRDRGRRGGAKLRCGGPTRADFPSVDEVVHFIVEASLQTLPFKATAGLHEPIGHVDPDIGAWRHGFLNLLIASVAYDQGEDATTVAAIVGEADPTTFVVSPMAAGWKHVRFPGSAIRRSRHVGFVAFGSCDVAEPLAALTDLDFLGDGA